MGTDAFNLPENLLADRAVPGSAECLSTLSARDDIVYLGARDPSLSALTLMIAGCGSHDGGGDPVKRVDPASLEVKEEAADEPDAILRVDEVVLRNPDLSTLARAIAPRKPQSRHQ